MPYRMGKTYFIISICQKNKDNHVPTVQIKTSELQCAGNEFQAVRSSKEFRCDGLFKSG